MKTTSAGALNTFLKQIENLPKPADDSIRFYRGQNVDNTPLPAIFRKNFNVDDEYSMFYDVINRKPEEFSNCKCAFDFLVKMQHYELPTRLLDITSNPLVALYFACTGESVESNKRTVFCFDIPKKSVKNFNSDSVSILSNLGRCNSDVKKCINSQIINLNKVISIYKHFFDEIDNNLQINGYNVKDKYEQNKNSFVNEFINENCKQYLLFCHATTYRTFMSENISHTETVKNNFEKIFKDQEYNLNLQDLFGYIENGKLLHEIKQDKPYFQDIMTKETFETVFCVNPKLDNPRIIAQSGSFLIFPSKLEQLRDIKINTIHLANNGVKKIKKQLEQLNIKEDTLFNELDKVCKFIKTGYEKNVENKTVK